MSRGKEKGLNKDYPYGKQAQVQCINLAWKCDTFLLGEIKLGTVVALLWSNNEDELYPNHANFPI
jgi:hypothetical protein